MNDSQSYHMKRSFKYICFQNSAHHFDNMISLKHCVDDKLDKNSAVYQKISPEMEVGKKFKMNVKRKKEVDRITRIENSKLLNKLSHIMNPKNQYPKHGNEDNMIYTSKSSKLGSKSCGRQDQFNPNCTFATMMLMSQERNQNKAQTPQLSQRSLRNKNGSQTNNSFNSTYQRKSELNSIDRDNFKIAKMIADCKPSVGTKEEWDMHYQQFKRNSSICRIAPSFTGLSFSQSPRKIAEKPDIVFQPDHLQKTYQRFIKTNQLFTYGQIRSNSVSNKYSLSSTAEQGFYQDRDPISCFSTRKNSMKQRKKIVISGQLENSAISLKEDSELAHKQNPLNESSLRSAQHIVNKSYQSYQPTKTEKNIKYNAHLSFTSPKKKKIANNPLELLQNTYCSAFNYSGLSNNRNSGINRSYSRKQPSTRSPETERNQIDPRFLEFEKLKDSNIDVYCNNQISSSTPKNGQKRLMQYSGDLAHSVNLSHNMSRLSSSSKHNSHEDIVESQGDHEDDNQNGSENNFDLKIKEIQDKYINLENHQKDR